MKRLTNNRSFGGLPIAGLVVIFVCSCGGGNFASEEDTAKIPGAATTPGEETVEKKPGGVTAPVPAPSDPKTQSTEGNSPGSEAPGSESTSGGATPGQAGSPAAGGAGPTSPTAEGGALTAGGAGGAGGAVPAEVVACPSYAAPIPVGLLTQPEVTEASGLVVSPTQDGIIWTHNDAGNGPQIFALNMHAGLVANVNINGAESLDWEDIALGPGPTPSTSYLYIGDIGDNDRNRQSISVYRVEEPVVGSSPGQTLTVTDSVQFKFAYPNGPLDARALLLDPITGDLFIISRGDDGLSTIWRAAAPLVANVTTTLEPVGTLTFGVAPLLGKDKPSAADVSPDGNYVGIRTKSHAFVWARQHGHSVPQTLLGPPLCAAIPLGEPEGEAMAFAPVGAGFYTLSEGKDQPLYHVSTH